MAWAATLTCTRITGTPAALKQRLCAQADELRALSGLAAEAAEILFEMAALHDSSEVARDMLDKAAQLQAQLRGMIGDFREGDEAALAQARPQMSAQPAMMPLLYAIAARAAAAA